MSGVEGRQWKARYTEEFRRDFKRLKDPAGKAVVVSRIERAERGNFGDFCPVGDKVYEMRIHVGPGYRVYFGTKGNEIIVLMVLGTKGTQERDIRKARRLWEN